MAQARSNISRSSGGTVYVDLTGALLAAGTTGEPLFFEIDGHPNERGYAVIGEAVVALIEDLRDAFGDDVFSPPK